MPEYVHNVSSLSAKTNKRHTRTNKKTVSKLSFDKTKQYKIIENRQLRENKTNVGRSEDAEKHRILSLPALITIQNE